MMELENILFRGEEISYAHAIESDNMEMLKFLYGLQYEMSEDDISIAIRTDDPKWLKQLSRLITLFRPPLTLDHIKLAFDRGNKAIIEQVLYMNSRKYKPLDVETIAATHHNYETIWPLFKEEINNPYFWEAALDEPKNLKRLQLLLSHGGDPNYEYAAPGEPSTHILPPLVHLFRKQGKMDYARPSDRPLKSVIAKIDFLVENGANLQWKGRLHGNLVDFDRTNLLEVAELNILYFKYLVDNYKFSKDIRDQYLISPKNIHAYEYLMSRKKYK